jgi:ubiquinone/menaquinone biosynthesis C-methylase UbiE
MGLFLADYSAAGSLRNRWRLRRFAIFRALFDRLPKPVRVLDVGGTAEYWRVMEMLDRSDVHITLLNVFPNEVTTPSVRALVGDARDLSQFQDRSFDIVFSNSVIEHVGNLEEQRRMANEIRRVGKNYIVQTPNRNFPIEAHVQLPLFQFLPITTRAWLHRNYALAAYPRAKDQAEAMQWAQEIQLLSKSELQHFFPEAKIVAERFVGLNKSYTAVYESP